MFLSECVVPWVILSTYHYNMLECSKCFTCSTSKFLWQKGLSQPISWQKGLFQPILVHLQKCPGCLVPFLWVRVHKCWSQVSKNVFMENLKSTSKVSWNFLRDVLASLIHLIGMRFHLLLRVRFLGLHPVWNLPHQPQKSVFMHRFYLLSCTIIYSPFCVICYEFES